MKRNIQFNFIIFLSLGFIYSPIFGMNTNTKQKKKVSFSNRVDIHKIPVSSDFKHLLTYSTKKIKKLLKKNPSIVNILNEKDRTLLMYAAVNDRLELISFLIKHRANAFIQDKKGNTVLHYTITYASTETLKYLIKKFFQANQDIKKLLSITNNKQETPITLAKKLHHKNDMAKFLSDFLKNADDQIIELQKALAKAGFH